MIDTSNCVHCGLCLPSCPTYQRTGIEPESPRGRVLLLREIAEHPAVLDQTAFRYLDDCLDCRACEAVCPSHVPTGHLVESWRAALPRHPLQARRATRRALRLFLGSRRGLRLLQRLAGLSRGKVVSGLLRGLPFIVPRGALRLQAGLPDTVPRRLSRDTVRLRGVQGARRVMLFAGCVMDAIYARTNERTADLLALGGVDVVLPKEQACCGALHRHAGDAAFAKALARRNIESFERSGAERVIANAAGCSAFLGEYGDLLAEDPAWSARARAFTEAVEDALPFLARLELPELPQGDRTVTVHDACHHAHAQGIRREPRELLRRAGFAVREMPSSDRCCGAAGSYAIMHPDMAAYLQRQKVQDVPPDEAVVAAANPGCSLQIRAGLVEAGRQVRVEHPLSLVWEAYRESGALGGDT